MNENIIDDLIESAKKFNNEGNFEKALKLSHKVLDIEKNNVLVMSLISDIYISQDEYEKAIPQMEEILEISPNLTKLHDLIGECYYYIKNFDEAIKHYIKSIELEGINSQKFFMLANSQERIPNFRMAITNYWRTIKLEETHAGAYLYCGRTYYFLNHLDDALYMFNMAMKYDPNNELEIKSEANEYINKIEQKIKAGNKGKPSTWKIDQKVDLIL